jgi:AraC-like DNA-binding protein
MPPADALFLLSDRTPVQAYNGGLFVSRGKGIHPRRVIDSSELILVNRGTLHLREQNKAFDLVAGQSLLLVAGHEHAGTRPYGPDCSFFWLHFRIAPETRPGTRRASGALASHGGTTARERSNARSHSKPQLIRVPQLATIARPDVLTALFRRFLEDQESGVHARQPMLGSLLVRLMLCEVALPPARAPVDGNAAAVADAARRYVATHYHRPIAASDVAEALGYNADYLGRCVRAALGRTITAEIHAARLRAARRMLLDTTETAGRIAASCGFTDAAYLRRLLRRSDGVGPRAYRRLHARVHINTS